MKHYDYLVKKGVIIDDEYQVRKDCCALCAERSGENLAGNIQQSPRLLQERRQRSEQGRPFAQHSGSDPCPCCRAQIDGVGLVQAAETQTVKNTGTNYTIIHNTAAPTHIGTYSAPKGVYIWGGPGCGKTYLMDLLFNSIQCPDIKKARVDFHSFMLEIHMKLHQLRQKYGPVPSFL